MEKVLMWREQGDTEWEEYNEASPLDDYEVGKIYTYEYKVIEREATVC
jgi:hypothetical protein